MEFLFPGSYRDALRGGYRRLLVLSQAILLAPLLSLAGCGPSSQPGSDDGSEKGKIAVVISTLNNPWFVVLKETAMKRAEELGYQAVEFDSQDDIAKETIHFENIIAGGYRAILFNPTDADASVGNVEKAKATGIPVFCMDREIKSKDAAVAQILSDNYSGCVRLGEYFVERVKKGEYVELLGLVGDTNTWNRSEGFHSVVDDHPELKRVGHQHADFNLSKAYKVMGILLQKNPGIKAVFCGNDAMAMGAYQALADAGKADQVMVFGFDGSADVIQAIADGKIEATMMQFPKVMAKTAAEWADQYLGGKRDFPQKHPVAVELITKENIDQYEGYGRKESQ